jgi:rod shape-determining protein MreD
MIVTPRIAVRIGLVVVAGVILQVSFFSYLSILGATPDFVAVVVGALGLLGGAVIGAVVGFAAGLLLDSILLQTLGISSLALIAVGYLAGRYREGARITNTLVPPILIGVFTLAGAAVFAAIQLMLGVETQVSLLVIREIVVKGILAFLLALPAYPLIRRLLRPALVDQAPTRGILRRAGEGRRARRPRRRGRSDRRKVAAAGRPRAAAAPPGSIPG